MKLKYIYETHLDVRNLERSIEFYKNLGLELAYVDKRRCAFFYVGENKQVLGLWEVPKNAEIRPWHFAFEVELNFLRNSKTWLEEKDIEAIGSQGKGNKEPIVQTWIPAASVYFLDLDGNKLEFISVLPNELKDLNYVPYLSEWEEAINSNS